MPNGSARIKKVTLGQVAAYLRGNNGNNTTAATDPGVSNDNTQGYFAGSLWVNTTNGRVWIAQSVATGAAAWALAVVPGTGVEPSSNLEQFGAGTATIWPRAMSTARSAPPASSRARPAPTTCSRSFRSPPTRSTYPAAGRHHGAGLVRRHRQQQAHQAHLQRRHRGGQGDRDGRHHGGGYRHHRHNGGGWSLQANVFKYGVNGSNTQIGLHQRAQINNAVAALLAPSLTGDRGGAILVAVTGNATTAASTSSSTSSKSTR